VHDILCNADATCLGGSFDPLRHTAAHQLTTMSASHCKQQAHVHAVSRRAQPTPQRAVVAQWPAAGPCCRRGRVGHGPVRRRPPAGHQAAMTPRPVAAVPRCCATVLLLLPPGQHGTGAGPAARTPLPPGPGRGAPAQAAAHRLLPKRWARSPPPSTPHLPRLLPCGAARAGHAL